MMYTATLTGTIGTIGTIGTNALSIIPIIPIIPIISINKAMRLMIDSWLLFPLSGNNQGIKGTKRHFQ